jgi:purine-binding chemotaxis protein CheW
VTGALVVFSLADRQYALDVADVYEIVRIVRITALPDTPPELLGVIDYRGTTTPVLDLRLRFDLPASAPTSISPLVIVRARSATLALLVDRVDGVMWVEVEPDATGTVRVADRLLVKLKPDSLLTASLEPLLTVV